MPTAPLLVVGAGAKALLLSGIRPAQLIRAATQGDVDRLRALRSQVKVTSVRRDILRDDADIGAVGADSHPVDAGASIRARFHWTNNGPVVLATVQGPHGESVRVFSFDDGQYPALDAGGDARGDISGDAGLGLGLGLGRGLGEDDADGASAAEGHSKAPGAAAPGDSTLSFLSEVGSLGGTCMHARLNRTGDRVLVVHGDKPGC